VAIRRYNPGYAPPATLVIVALNVAVSLIDMFTGEYVSRLFWARGIDIQYGEYWRLFTCAWVHGDLMHIAFNAYGIYILGSIFERLHGFKPFLVVYLVSLLGGSALAIAFMDPNVPLVGASAAAYGLFGAVLGFFYAKTGSLRALWEIPYSRMLLIWLAFGVYMSLRPGVSFLGHLGGFVPGVVLGVFFEHRYARQLDIYHKLSAGVVVAAVVLLLAFASAPFTRASWYGARALRAFENGEFERGDQLLAQAKGRNMSQEGAVRLLTHLRVWRRYHETRPEEYDVAALRMALTHPALIEGGEAAGQPFAFLIDPEAHAPLEAARDTD
jgi:membrane associated rhomboid family serine protease